MRPFTALLWLSVFTVVLPLPAKAFGGGGSLFLSVSVHRVSDTPGNLLELFFLLEILKIYWKFAKSPGNLLAEFMCLSLVTRNSCISQCTSRKHLAVNQ